MNRERQRTYEAGGTLERRLVGRPLPDVQLQYAHEAFLSPVELARRRSLVIFFYPASEETTTPQNGSTVSADEQRAVAWMRCEGELNRLGYDVIGVSTQSSIQQAWFASREPLPYILLSDPKLKLAEGLADDPDREGRGLPTDGPPTQRVYQAAHANRARAEDRAGLLPGGLGTRVGNGHALDQDRREQVNNALSRECRGCLHLLRYV